MPEQFVSYNPTQVGQGNNIVYQPVNQQYGELFAKGLSKVAAQKAKAAKDAQEKEYSYKPPTIGGSTFIPKYLSGAMDELAEEARSTPNFSTDKGVQNNFGLKTNTLKTDAQQLALGEKNYAKLREMVTTSPDPNIARATTIIDLDRKQSKFQNEMDNIYSKQTDKKNANFNTVREGARYLSDPANNPKIYTQVTLDKALSGVNPYSIEKFDESNLKDANKSEFYKQSSQEKKFIRKDNLDNLVSSTQKNAGVRNWYRENDFARAGDINTKADADMFVVNEYYKGKLDEDKFANDPNYRESIVDEAYKKQEEVINERIYEDVLSKFGVDARGLKNIENTTKFTAIPGASSGAKQQEEFGASVTSNGTILKNPIDKQNWTSTVVSAKFGTKGIPVKLNPSTISGMNLYTEQGTKAPVGSSDNNLVDMHKTYMVSNLNENKSVPIILYKKNGARYLGDINKAIEGGLENYNIVDPNHISDGNELDAEKHLLSYADFKSKYGTWDIVPGYALTFSNAEKATTTGGLNETTTAPLTDVSSVVGYIPQSKAGKNQIFKMLSEKKLAGKPFGSLDESTGNFQLNGKDLWNNTKLRSVDKTTGKFRQGSTQNLTFAQRQKLKTKK